jgi:lysozyme
MPRSKKKKKRNLMITILMISILLIAIGIVIFDRFLYFLDTREAYHPSFGIRIPNGYTVHGIDVSRHQARITWEKVATMESMGKKIHFCFIKATQGNYKIDPYFERNWQHSRDAGLIRGAYHYFDPKIKGDVQADYFLKTYESKPGDLPPVLDVEETGNIRAEIIRREVKKWLDKVEKNTGVKPFIYTHTQFYRSILGEVFDVYPFWVAHYHAGDEPRIFRDWYFWQHSESGYVNGIKGKVDFNVFSGDSLSLEKLRIKN